ncbi:unnamed protein product [[Candida] boidinii]|nr:unnamed protein product [[Candida] boidinii]
MAAFRENRQPITKACGCKPRAESRKPEDHGLALASVWLVSGWSLAGSGDCGGGVQEEEFWHTAAELVPRASNYGIPKQTSQVSVSVRPEFRIRKLASQEGRQDAMATPSATLLQLKNREEPSINVWEDQD